MLGNTVMCLEECSESAPICGNVCCDEDAECVNVGGTPMCSVTGSGAVSATMSLGSINTGPPTITSVSGGSTTGTPAASLAVPSAASSGAKIVPVSTANGFPTVSIAVVAGIVGVMAGLVCVM